MWWLGFGLISLISLKKQSKIASMRDKLELVVFAYGTADAGIAAVNNARDAVEDFMMKSISGK
jgi:hypothetical protein